MAQEIKNPPAMQKTWVWSLGQDDALEEEMATSSSIPVWKSHGQRNLVDYSPKGHKELDMTEWLSMHAYYVHNLNIWLLYKLNNACKTLSKRLLLFSHSVVSDSLPQIMHNYFSISIIAVVIVCLRMVHVSIIVSIHMFTDIWFLYYFFKLTPSTYIYSLNRRKNSWKGN